MKVAVFGLGYVGCVTAAVLAREGNDVMGVDVNAAKVDALARGECPVAEPGLPELVRRCHETGRLAATTDAVRAVDGADVVVICVGTPSKDNGALDTRFVARAAGEIGEALASCGGHPVVVLRSTVLPDAAEDIVLAEVERRSGKRAGEGFGFVVNPEFLREGSGIADFDEPQFTLLGVEDERSAAVVRRLYGFLNAPVVTTDRRTAAIVKYASNAFHAVKVTFANEVSALAAAVGADGREAMRILALDRKLNLSAAYLRPGMPFGGSCLPKDLRTLVHRGRQADVALPLLGGAIESNRLQAEACVARILAHGRVRVGILGLAFKPGTDDLRESPAVAIVESLLGKGIRVAVYDRHVSPERLVGANRDYVAEHLPHVATLLRETLEEVLDGSDVLVVTTRDDEYRRVAAMLRPGQTLIDLVDGAASGVS